MVTTRRLGAGEGAVAKEMFATLAAVFEDERATPLDDDRVAAMLERDDFWAVVAMEEGAVVGGLTAHVLPMTRSPATELFLYDLAVRADRQRRGIGRALVTELLALARAAGIETTFVPADNEDTGALEFYRAMGGAPSPVTIFTFSR